MGEPMIMATKDERKKVGEQLNMIQVQSWKVLEYLIDQQYDLASTGEVSRATEMPEHVARRILMTWEFVGLVERRGNLWRLTPYLSTEIPYRLKLALAEKLRGLEAPTPPHIPAREDAGSSSAGVGPEVEKS